MDREMIGTARRPSIPGRRRLLAAAASAPAMLLPGRGGNASTLAGTSTALPALGAMFLQSIIYEGFRLGPAFDPFTTLSNNGVQTARTLITTVSCPELDTMPYTDWRQLGWKEAFWSCREMGAAVLRRAADAGMSLQLGLFLSDAAADAGIQRRPSAWASLSDTQLVTAVRQYGQEVASYYRSRGLKISVFEIGNETDFGICGYRSGDTIPIPIGIDSVNDPTWMRDNVWIKCVPLYKAAIQGIRTVFPESSIALHAAGFGYSTADLAPVRFFTFMSDQGVDFQIAGFSYPYLFAGAPPIPQPYFQQASFLSALNAVKALQKRIQILEFDYPAAAAGIAVSQAPYACTEAGQTEFLTQFLRAVAGLAEQVHYWAADVFPGINGIGGLPASMESTGLFAAADRARSGVGALRRLASDRLFDWAQMRFPSLFPDTPGSNTWSPYYYRYHPTNGMYVGVDESTGQVLLHNGREWNLTPVGTLKSLLDAAQSSGLS